MLESPEGVVRPQSPFYVTRKEDSIALASIGQRGGIITIKGPNQIGKTSLLYQTIEAAKRAQKRVVLIDFQTLDKTVLEDADRFFRAFCQLITAELEIEDRAWNARLPSGANCTRSIEHVLKILDSPLVLAMDEVDVLFEASFGQDFFSMLRAWHNRRGFDPGWDRLDLLLVISTEPYLHLQETLSAPFNVGEMIEPGYFTLDQVIDLNQRHGSPLHTSEVRQLMDLIAGHPYLVRRALYRLATNMITVDQLFAQATDDRGPFGDHLRYHLFRLHDNQRLVRSLREVIDIQTCSDERDFLHLQEAGLVRRLEGRTVTTRCRLYSDYFKERL